MKIKRKKSSQNSSPKNIKYILWLVSSVILISSIFNTIINSAKPSINSAQPSTPDGLDPSEAAFLQKSLSKDKIIKGSTSVAPVATVKVTAKVDGKDVTGKVVLKQLTKKEISDIEGSKDGVEIQGLKLVEQLTKAPPQPESSGDNSPTSTFDPEAACSTNGSPIYAGTWITTGQYTDNKDIATAECVQCIGNNQFGKEVRECKSQIGTDPVVLPSHLRDQIFTGQFVSSCFAEVKGSWMAIGIGDKVEGKEGDVYCSPKGTLVSDLRSDDDFASFCYASSQLPMCLGLNGTSSVQTPVVTSDSKVGHAVLKFSDCDTGRIALDSELNYVCMPENFVCVGEDLSGGSGTFQICTTEGVISSYRPTTCVDDPNHVNDWVTDGNGGCVPPPQAEAPKCGPGFTYRDGYCDDNYAGDHGGGFFIDMHLYQKAKCSLQLLPYDPNTGLCQSPTAGRPRNCTPGLSKDSKSYTTCDLASNGTISESIRFCSAGTFTSDGNCQVEPLTTTPQSNVALPPLPACNPRILSGPTCDKNLCGSGAYTTSVKENCEIVRYCSESTQCSGNNIPSGGECSGKDDLGCGSNSCTKVNSAQVSKAIGFISYHEDVWRCVGNILDLDTVAEKTQLGGQLTKDQEVCLYGADPTDILDVYKCRYISRLDPYTFPGENTKSANKDAPANSVGVYDKAYRPSQCQTGKFVINSDHTFTCMPEDFNCKDQNVNPTPSDSSYKYCNFRGEIISVKPGDCTDNPTWVFDGDGHCKPPDSPPAQPAQPATVVPDNENYVQQMEYVRAMIVDAARAKMANCKPGWKGLNNACYGEFYQGQILQEGDLISTEFAKDPQSIDQIYWCTQLVFDAAEAADLGITEEDKIYDANKLYQEFINEDIIIPTYEASYNGGDKEIVPGMVMFVNIPNDAGAYATSHTAIVTDVRETETGDVYVDIIQANSGDKELTYELNEDGRLEVEVDGKIYFAAGFGKMEDYAFAKNSE